MVLYIGILLVFSLDFSQGISVGTNGNYTFVNRANQYYTIQYQFQYQPDIGGNWQNWGSRPSFQISSNNGPLLVGHGSAIPIVFPGQVNNNKNSNNNRTNSYTSTTPSTQRNNTSTPSTQNLDKNQNTGVKFEKNCKCGEVQKSSRLLERITGGSLSKENAWPWMAAIVYIGTETPFWFCGASLINNRYLITAAHCQRTINRRGLSKIRILMGTNGIPSQASASELFEISEIKTHPLYKPNIEEYDIGLIKLKNAVTFTEKISPICLTQRGSPFLDRKAIVAGWGSIKYGDSPPDALREVEIKVVSNANCQREYMYNYGTRITSAMLCAWLPGKDSCQGDSGGPLFLKTTTEPEVYTQIGIVSFGPPQCGETTIPGVYTRVASTIRWIKANTKDATYCSGAF